MIKVVAVIEQGGGDLVPPRQGLLPEVEGGPVIIIHPGVGLRLAGPETSVLTREPELIRTSGLSLCT